MAKLSRYIRPYMGYICLTLLIKTLGAFAELTIPYLMEYILSRGAETGQTRLIFYYGGWMLFCAVACLVLNITANRMSAISSGKITLALRHDLFEKLNSLSARQMDELVVSSAESRLTSDTYNINQLLARVQRLGIRAPILLVGGVAMMLMMDAGLALILIALLPIIVLIVYLVTKTTIPLYTQQQSVLDRMVRTLQENITGIRIVKALSKTEYEKARFNGINDELSAIDRKAGSISAATNPAASLVLNLGLTLVVLIGSFRVNSGLSESATLVAFLQYFIMILNAMLGVTRIFIMWSKGEASALRVAEVFALEEDLAVVAQEEEHRTGPHIEFRDVRFSYTGRGDNLSNLSFRLERGQTLGILGATGSGKSTIVNLLMRIYDPDEGEIRINGKDIRTMERQELKSMFGVVFQNDFVTGGTVADNIRFFREIPDEKLEIAARHAQAASFIKEKEGAMAAEVTFRGNNLSGGQKQRLLIARALAGDPEILVLDDASSALDYRTDAQLRAALGKNYGNTTTVLIAQRVSSLRHADLILVLSDGQVIGSGDHAHLMETCEEYRIIAQTQMGARGEEGVV